MPRIRRVRLVEAQLAQLAHLLGTMPGPHLVEDVTERLREMREEYEVECDLSAEYRQMWARERERSQQRGRALARAVALLQQQRASRSSSSAREQ